MKRFRVPQFRPAWRLTGFGDKQELTPGIANLYN